jgi:Fur family ferric uptake transcriptional regulator
MKTTINLKAEVEKFTAFLTTKRLRKTPERFEILKCVLDCKGHFDVDLLYNKLESESYHVSRATIYSTLELLCASGVVRKLLFDTHQARYERAEQSHSHLVCTQCGEINEIDLVEIDSRLSEMKFKHFTPAYVSTCIYGICEKCRKNNENRQNQ